MNTNDLKKHSAAFVDELDAEGLEQLTQLVKASPLHDRFAAAASGHAHTDLPPLPEKAPALWTERTTGREVSPADFIRKHYGHITPDLPDGGDGSAAGAVALT